MVETCDVPAYKKRRSLSSQEAARIVRYRFLEEVRNKVSATKIALGHNANDQAEMLMMWLFRGAGLKGLGGMPPVRGVIIRPLIETTRKEIEEFLSKKNIPFVLDSSNQKSEYVRNRIRKEIFPLLEEHYNPQIVKKLVNTAQILSIENDYLENTAQKLLDDITVSEKATTVVIGKKELLALPLAMQLRCLRAVLQKVKGDLKRISSIHLYDILGIAASAEPHKVLTLPDGIRVEKSYLRLKLTTNQDTFLPFTYHYSSIPDRVSLKEIGKEMVFELMDGTVEVTKNKNPCVAYLDAEKVVMPLIIRNAKPGDRFQPFGMDGEKKIKNFFSDEKVELNERKRVPLVFCGELLGWVGGMRINHCLRVTRATKRMLKIELH
jgi:tRNA(Ile)-lysidine synthase